MKKIFLFLAVAGIFASCAKSDNDTAPIDASKTKLLMDEAWQLKAYTVNPDINDSTAFPMDQYTAIPGCIKDNYYVFNSATVVTRHEGDSKCNLNDPDSVVMGYQLTENEKHIKIWSNPDDPDHSVILDGAIVYPSIDSFMVTYQQYDSITELTSEHVKTYVKYILE